MDAILDPMIIFYKTQLERAQEFIELLEKQNRELLQERDQLSRSFERLEIYTEHCEARLEYLRDVLNRHVDNATNNVRRDLLDEFNQVARDHNIEYNEIELLFPDEELESDDENIIIEL